MATPNYDINYNDKRFTQVNSDKNVALSNVEKTYGGMINNSDKYYKNLIEQSKKNAETQKKNQQANTDFAIEKIEQQKEQAKTDYVKEQSGAYVDWQKQSNQYGAESEKKAAGGFTGSGYSESSQVSMYNTYQNRVATARDLYNRSILNYNNAITEARLQNNSALAEIFAKANKEQLELALQGFQYKNQLIIDKANQKLKVDEMYYGRYQDVLKQINTENALAENVRQYNEKLAEEKRQYNETIALQKQEAANNQAYRNAQLALEREKFNYTKSQAAISKSSGSSSVKKKGSSSNAGKYSSSSRNKKQNANVKKTAVQGPPAINTYENAAKYLQSKGISGDGGLMTKSEWSRRKRSGSDRAEAAYSSYTDYLKAYVNWRIGK